MLFLVTVIAKIRELVHLIDWQALYNISPLVIVPSKHFAGDPSAAIRRFTGHSRFFSSSLKQVEISLLHLDILPSRFAGGGSIGIGSTNLTRNPQLLTINRLLRRCRTTIKLLSRSSSSTLSAPMTKELVIILHWTTAIPAQFPLEFVLPRRRGPEPELLKGRRG